MACVQQFHKCVGDKINNLIPPQKKDNLKTKAKALPS
jgi:hypothetical protein